MDVSVEHLGHEDGGAHGVSLCVHTKGYVGGTVLEVLHPVGHLRQLQSGVSVVQVHLHC